MASCLARGFHQAVVVTAAVLACRAAYATDRFQRQRDQMVDDEIVAAGVKNERIVRAMREVPRHEFVTPDQRNLSYFDMSLPIGHGQTISPPYMVAMMSERLDPQPTDKVLEVGTGSGYQAAVLSKLVHDVYTIEIVEALARCGRHSPTNRLPQRASRGGDGFEGWAQYAPFDKIIVTCSPHDVPQPLIEQLKEGGRMIVPVGERFQQTLYLFQKRQGKLVRQALEPTMFVPMTGQADSPHRGDSSGPTSLFNGDFEAPSRFADNPEGWYYARQAKVEASEDAPSGKKCLTISNSVAGRHGQALQAIGVDGRQVARLDVDFWVRTRDVKAGPTPENQAMVLVTYFDDERATVGQAVIGPWAGTMPWTRQKGQLQTPRSARLAVVAIGLLGATGEISFDDFHSTAIAATAQRRPVVKSVK